MRGFRGSDKKQQMAKESTHASVHLWASGTTHKAVMPAEPSQPVLSSLIFLSVLKFPPEELSSCSHSGYTCIRPVMPIGFKEQRLFCGIFSLQSDHGHATSAARA